MLDIELAKLPPPTPDQSAISWKAQNRLHFRLLRLSARRVPRNKALVAVARELCGLIWAVLRSCH